jgi:hypothetical protein
MLSIKVPLSRGIPCHFMQSATLHTSSHSAEMVERFIAHLDFSKDSDYLAFRFFKDESDAH